MSISYAGGPNEFPATSLITTTNSSTRIMLLRQGFVCPKCQCIKDAYDPETDKTLTVRWCWNLRAHPRRRKMRPTALWRFVP